RRKSLARRKTARAHEAGGGIVLRRCHRPLARSTRLPSVLMGWCSVASAIVRTPPVHARDLCEALAVGNRTTQAHNAAALVAARSAWVPGLRAGSVGQGAEPSPPARSWPSGPP